MIHLQVPIVLCFCVEQKMLNMFVFHCRTNVPIECMGFLNYPFPKKQRSFVHHTEVLAFFETFADDFNLHHVIRFQTQVVNIRPLENDRWEV